MGLLSGKVAVVTGAGRGIGRAVALALAAEGAAVAASARSSPEISGTAAAIRNAGGQAVAIPVDVARQDMVDAMFARTRQELGPVDILVNNAAAAGPVGLLWETDASDWLETLDVNVLGMVRCVRAVLPDMISRRSGKIIIVGSGAGREETIPCMPGEFAAYCVSKAAVNYLAVSLAHSVREYGINVNCVGVGAQTRLSHEHQTMLAQSRGRPEPTAWEQLPSEERVLPEENVALFVFLASSLSDHIAGQYVEANSLPDAMRRGQ